MIYLRKANERGHANQAGWTPGILSLLPTITIRTLWLLRAARD